MLEQYTKSTGCFVANMSASKILRLKMSHKFVNIVSFFLLQKFLSEMTGCLLSVLLVSLFFQIF